MTLKPLLDLLLPEFAPALIGDGARAALETAARVMAPIPHVAIECRLAVDQAQVDIQQQLRRHTDDARLLSRHLAGFAGAGETPVRLSRFCDAWGAADTALAGVEEVFLEYDVPGDGRATEIPGIFFSLPREDGWDTACAAIAILHDGYSSDTLEGCFHAAKTSGAWVGYLGLLLNRVGNPTRVNVKGMRPHALRAFLDGIGWNGDRDAAEALFDWALNHVDRVTLALDIGNGAVLPRLGLECLLKRQPAVERRWSALLEALERQGLCDGDKRAAVLAAPGVTAPMLAGPPWLPQWIARSLAAPADQFGVLERALYYIKLTLESDGSREAKAYFGARDAWLVQEQGKVRELSPVPHEPIDDSVPAPSTEAMMERASAALFERQGQNGLWRDFLLFNDESNEWASAFIATALVEACGRRASRAATDAMSRLARQQRPDGGWGYDNASVSDADSTAWVLRLHARFGGLEGDSAARAAAFLSSHEKSGGIATYREEADLSVFAIVTPDMPDEGWKQAHCCVTAAAAPFVDWDVRPYLAAEQAADGSWRSYWWCHGAYPTALCSEALANDTAYAANVDAACAWAMREAAHPELNDFDAAWCLRILLLRPQNDAARLAAMRMVERLRQRQSPDGRWRTGALARFPMPDLLFADLDSSDRIFPFQDQHGLFTTAAVVAALARWKGGGDES